jgi:hypothetical protein
MRDLASAPRRTEVVLHWASRHRVGLILSATIVLAAAVRLVRLDLMEFKEDESEACRLALHVLGRSEPGLGTFFPTTGLEASVGIPNPPLFVYLMALPLAVMSTPMAAVVFVAATNVVAVWLCYVAGRRYFSTFVGLAAAAMFAVSPWAIVYSRKIWAQDLLPICTGLFLLALHEFLVGRRPRALLWLLLLVGVSTQLHFSAWVLGGVALAAIALGRDTVERRWVALGLGGMALLYLPYVWHLVAVGHVREAGATVTPEAARRFTSSVRDTFAVGAGDRMYTLVGFQSIIALPFALVFGTASFAGLLGACRGWRARPTGRARLLLPLWFVLPIAMLTALPLTPYLHYFIVLYPLPFLGAALALEALIRHRRALGWISATACLCAFAFLDWRSFRGVLVHGGSPDYGVGYRNKDAAATWFVHANQTRHFELALDPPEENGLREYRLLVWIHRGLRTNALRPPAVLYVLSESFGRRASPLKHLSSHASHIKHFGPLTVTIVPLKRAAAKAGGLR